MATKDYSLPHLDMIDLVPKNLRNPMVTSLIDNLFNRFLTKDEAVPLYGYVGRKPAAPDDRTPKIPQSTVERDINALIPVFSFKAGTEVHSFTPQDLIRKTQVMGVSEDQNTWLYSQGNNYAPPIDFDKFTNFFNYFWVADALATSPDMAWNPTNAPEYYTMAAPQPSDLDKLNVRVATTAPIVLTGTGFLEQTWTVTFGVSTFTVSCVLQPAVVAGEENQTFTLSATPDQGAVVKAATTADITLSGLQIIDGVTLIAGDRVLVKNQTLPQQNGVYVAAAGAWTRATDFNSAAELSAAVPIRVTGGTANLNTIWQSNSTVVTVGTEHVVYDDITIGPWPTVAQTVNFLASNSPTSSLLKFDIVRDMVYDGDGRPLGYENFDVGDQFTITAPFISSTYLVTFTGSTGTKGKIANVNSLDEYQTIDGVQVAEGDRVLVKNQTLPTSSNGIYIVKPGAWVRAEDFDGATETAGARVFVQEGTVNEAALFTSSAPNWTWTLTAQPTISNTNDWQENNFWVKGDDIATGGYDVSKVVQATRPIIEFHSNLPLNTRFDANGPINVGGTLYEQVKTEFNQAPVFDLYRYDGTHARKVSSIFFYQEDPTAEIDTALQRRVKHATNESGDFLFAHGLLDDVNTLLFYKTSDGALHTIWHPGYSQATVVDQTYGGTGDGTLSVDVVGTDPFTAQQIWTLTALSPSVFEVSGSKAGLLPSPYNTVLVGTPYTNGLFNATITAGPTPFVAGDVFTFRIGNFETTRYVYRDGDQALVDFFGGPIADLNNVAAWQVPRMFYHNVAADNGDEVPEGTLYSHFRGILANQIGTTEDRAFGGSVKLWSEQQNLLAALMMQRDMTPISMIDLAQRQYEQGLNTIVDIYLTNIVTYLSSTEAVITPVDEEELLDAILAIRAKDNDVRTVLYDSTSGVTGFPATLPQLGVTPAVVPGVYFDNELGATLMRHHDGHASPLYTYNQAFRDRILSPGLLVERSDGAFTPAVGSFTITPPANPYKGEIWLYPTGTGDEFRVFNVLSDGTIAPTATTVGQFWYNRATGLLQVWDGAVWVAEPNPLAPWVTMDPADVLNNILLIAEERLYEHVNADHRTYFTQTEVENGTTGAFAEQLERELATWAMANGYDPFAPNYVSSDAFTWNYSSLALGSVAPLSTPTVPARWFDVLKAHHETFGALVVPTARPNLEPWKLLGNSTKPLTWDAMYAAPVTPAMVDAGGYVAGDPARVVLYSAAPVNTTLAGLPTVDGVTLTAGDAILLVSEASPQNNGLWNVSSGGWTRSSMPLVANTVVPVMEGLSRSGTAWVITTAPAVVNVDPVVFSQVRTWQQQMWVDIQTARPTLKLSVDVNRDVLLPPYVSGTLPWSVNALTTTMVPDPAEWYEFGEHSPVESVWLKSIEYRYSLARALFRQSPLEFLGFCWGFEWVEVDGILYDGYDIAMPGHPRFRLHGDPVVATTRTAPIALTSISGPIPVDVTITHDGYTAAHKQSWTIRTADDVIIGYVDEGTAYMTISANGYTVTNLEIEDEGRPFRVGDSFHVTANANGTGMVVVFNQAPYHQILGFGQTFTHALRASSIDTSQGYAMQAYRGWDVNLGYRAGGLVSTDDLRVFTDTDALPESSYELRFKRSPYAKDLWLQGLRVTVVQLGHSTPAPVAGYVPTGRCEDWVFRIEGYNARYLGFEYYELNTALDYMTFEALRGEHTRLSWNHYLTPLNKVSTQLPFTVTGLQNLINVLFGYAAFLEDEGWRFDDENASNTDAATGRVRNWQLEIEKLIDKIYAGIDLGEGHVVNPFIDRVWIEQDQGLLSKYFDTSLFDVNAHPGIFDTLGIKMNTTDLLILRSPGRSMLSAKVPMFSVHSQIDEFEHLFVFNNYASPSTGEDLIYDPFSGARIVTIKLNGRRQAASTLRPEFGGHYLVGDEVKRNLQSNTDKVAQYYDTDHVFEDELSTRHALALLGFTPKEYMSNLDLNDRTQFNFWRGLVQMKGTNASIDAFLNNDRFQDAKLDEYWAYKIAEYGDSRSKIYPELRLTVDDTLQQFTKFIFDPTLPVPADFNTFVQISSEDEDRWFSIDDLGEETSFEAQVAGTYNKLTVANEVLTLPFVADKLIIRRPSVRAATTTNITRTLAATPVLDGVTLAVGDRVLVKDQTTTSQNGVFVVSSSGTWPRDDAYSTASELNVDATIYVREGTTQVDTFWERVTPLVSYTYVQRPDVGVSIVNSSTLLVTAPGRVEVTGMGPATPKFNPVKLFNFVEAELIEEIPLWHPAYNQHTPAALSSINIISDLDPARYNVSTLVSGNVNYDPLRMWGAREVGRVWWDTTNLDYVPYYDATIYPTVDERLNRWGALADYATVDVVEWVESTVAPADYDTQSAIDAGDADLDPYTKADGQVYGAKTYSRDREWQIRPIAWSQAGVATAAAHPSFNASYISNLMLPGNGLAVLETGNFSDYGIEAGMRIGAWQEDSTATRPLSEYVVLDAFTKQITGVPVNPAAVSGFDGTLTLTMIEHTDKVGQLLFASVYPNSASYVVATPVLFDDTATAVGWDVASYLRVTEVDSGEEDIVQIRNDRGTGASSPLHGATFTTAVGQIFAWDFQEFGLRLELKSTVAGTFSTQLMVQFLAQALSNLVSMRDAVSVEVVSPLSDPDSLVIDSTEFSNDVDDPQYTTNNGVGWRAWSVPTQAQLDADTRAPNSEWYPYLGEFVTLNPVSIAVVQDAAEGGSTFTLNNGTTIERYQTDWSEWTELKQELKRETALVAGDVTFPVDVDVTIDRVSVYVNGVAQLTGTYTLVGQVLTVLAVAQGHQVVAVIRPYSPTTTELEFDPDVTDDLLIQRQYKTDYQYVAVPVRDSEGSITSTKYYFWVKNRSTAARKKNLSVKAVAQLLSNGPSQYLTFQHMIWETDPLNNQESGFRYDAITLAGLNYVVTKDDTFKLRFTRDFTLRDDPQQLDLKDTHVEWSLIRPGQRTKIPEQLWNKMVDTACGQDTAGNTLPAPRRVSYDERNGTRTQFGFGADQVLAPTDLVRSTLQYTILNTKLVDDSGAVPVPDYMLFLDFNQSDTWFEDATSTRNTLTTIWNQAKVSQINELFFAVLNDICAANYEMTDLFKTSRLSAYSIKVVSASPIAPTYE